LHDFDGDLADTLPPTVELADLEDVGDFELVDIELADVELADFKLVNFELVNFELVDVELADFKLVDVELTGLTLVNSDLPESVFLASSDLDLFGTAKNDMMSVCLSTSRLNLKPDPDFFATFSCEKALKFGHSLVGMRS
jgi:uncharacterized protein YjbI with pentapeptide repeats